MTDIEKTLFILKVLVDTNKSVSINKVFNGYELVITGDGEYYTHIMNKDFIEMFLKNPLTNSF